jgi:hypothetical protein
MEHRMEVSASPSSSIGISESCFAKEIMDASDSGKEAHVDKTSRVAFKKASSSMVDILVKKSASRDDDKGMSFTDISENEERERMSVDSTVDKSTQKPLT